MWSNFVKRGAKLVYNQYNPLVKQYMNLSKQYRNAIGLKPLNNVYRNKEQISFVFKKPSGNVSLRNIPRIYEINVPNRYKRSEMTHGLQVSNMGGGGFYSIAASAYALPFIEDKELLTILKKARNNRNNAILKMLRQRGLKNVGPLLLGYVRKPSN
jgi:hypothetical protein